jgi:hypothetical protein
MYFEICKSQMSRYEGARTELRIYEERVSDAEFESEEYWTYRRKTGDLSQEVDRSGTIVIVFAAMCLEALIYDYGVRYTSKNFFDRYLDKLSHKSKWVVVPRIVTGESLDTGSQAFEQLQKLIQDRNNLVHNESTEVPIHNDEELFEWVEENEEWFL